MGWGAEFSLFLQVDASQTPAYRSQHILWGTIKLEHESHSSHQKRLV
jgi:hypothetical protein